MKKFNELKEAIVVEKENWYLAFQFTIDYFGDEGGEIQKDLERRFKNEFSGSGSGGVGFDIGFSGPEKNLLKIKKYIEKKYKKQLDSKYTNMYLDESLNTNLKEKVATRPMTFKFPSEKNAKQFAYDVSNSATANVKVVGKKVILTLLPTGSVSKSHKTVAKYMKKRSGKLTEDVYNISEWVVTSETPEEITIGDESMVLEKNSASVLIDVCELLSEENQILFKEKINGSMDGLKQMIQFAYNNAK